MSQEPSEPPSTTDVPLPSEGNSRRVGLVFGGRSAEHEVSVLSARTVAGALQEAGHRVVPLGVSTAGCWVPEAEGAFALDGGVDRLELEASPGLGPLGDGTGVDLLFPLIHGTWGEDGTLQGLAEILGLPYVGCDVTSSAVAMDKVLCKRQLAASGLPVTEYRAVGRSAFERDPRAFLESCEDLPLPLFVKPAVGGSSVGIQKLEHRQCLETTVREAFRFDDTVLVERGVQGREIECAVLGHSNPKASVLGEIIPGKDFYDYADKYLEEGAQLIAPAPLPEATEGYIRALAVRAFEALGASGLARVDFLLEAGAEERAARGEGLTLNEINTVPGFTDISMYPRLWRLSGLELPALVDRLVALAFERHQERRRLDEGIRAWLDALTETA